MTQQKLVDRAVRIFVALFAVLCILLTAAMVNELTAPGLLSPEKAQELEVPLLEKYGVGEDEYLIPVAYLDLEQYHGPDIGAPHVMWGPNGEKIIVIHGSREGNLLRVNEINIENADLVVCCHPYQVEKRHASLRHKVIGDWREITWSRLLPNEESGGYVLQVFRGEGLSAPIEDSTELGHTPFTIRLWLVSVYVLAIGWVVWILWGFYKLYKWVRRRF